MVAVSFQVDHHITSRIGLRKGTVEIEGITTEETILVVDRRHHQCHPDTQNSFFAGVMSPGRPNSDSDFTPFSLRSGCKHGGPASAQDPLIGLNKFACLACWTDNLLGLGLGHIRGILDDDTCAERHQCKAASHLVLRKGVLTRLFFHIHISLAIHHHGALVAAVGLRKREGGRGGKVNDQPGIQGVEIDPNHRAIGGISRLSVIPDGSQPPSTGFSCNFGDVLRKHRLRFSIGIVGLDDGLHFVAC